MAITQRTEKMTDAEAEAMGMEANPIANYIYYEQERLGKIGRLKKSVFPDQNKTIKEVSQSMVEDFKSRWFSSQVVKNLGDPLAKHKGLEHTAGLYVFDDTDSGITFLLWSDGYKKNPARGTSYEAIVPSGQEDQLGNAMDRLLAYLREAMTAKPVEEEDEGVEPRF